MKRTDLSRVGTLYLLNSIIQFVPVNKCYSSGGDGGAFSIYLAGQLEPSGLPPCVVLARFAAAARAEALVM